ncbi:MAG: PEGA domain-containing protein [Cytophagaceae bacterium]
MERLIILLLSAGILSSCASTTLIQSEPAGAKVYIDGNYVGQTPYAYTDRKITGMRTNVMLEKEGYNKLNTEFSRTEDVDAGAIVGGVFFTFPFLWTMKYKPARIYELQEINPAQVKADGKLTSSKLERLKELKTLQEQGILTQEEFEREKQKVLSE